MSSAPTIGPNDEDVTLQSLTASAVRGVGVFIVLFFAVQPLFDCGN
jgi:hypothetical protein